MPVARVEPDRAGSRAVFSRWRSSASGLGRRPRRLLAITSAATPETWGAAMEVPSKPRGRPNPCAARGERLLEDERPPQVGPAHARVVGVVRVRRVGAAAGCRHVHVHAAVGVLGLAAADGAGGHAEHDRARARVRHRPVGLVARGRHHEHVPWRGRSAAPRRCRGSARQRTAASNSMLRLITATLRFAANRIPREIAMVSPSPTASSTRIGHDLRPVGDARRPDPVVGALRRSCPRRASRGRSGRWGAGRSSTKS